MHTKLCSEHHHDSKYRSCTDNRSCTRGKPTLPQDDSIARQMAREGHRLAMYPGAAHRLPPLQRTIIVQQPPEPQPTHPPLSLKLIHLQACPLHLELRHVVRDEAAGVANVDGRLLRHTSMVDQVIHALKSKANLIATVQQSRG